MFGSPLTELPVTVLFKNTRPLEVAFVGAGRGDGAARVVAVDVDDRVIEDRGAVGEDEIDVAADEAIVEVGPATLGVERVLIAEETVVEERLLIALQEQGDGGMIGRLGIAASCSRRSA